MSLNLSKSLESCTNDYDFGLRHEHFYPLSRGLDIYMFLTQRTVPFSSYLEESQRKFKCQKLSL